MNFKNARIYTENFCYETGGFSVENGRFHNVLGPELPDSTDLHGAKVIPGLLDVHTHGNSGADFSDGSYEGLVMMARYQAANGVTSFAPSSLTLPFDQLRAAYQTAAAQRVGDKYHPFGSEHTVCQTHAGRMDVKTVADYLGGYPFILTSRYDGTGPAVMNAGHSVK